RAIKAGMPPGQTICCVSMPYFASIRSILHHESDGLVHRHDPSHSRKDTIEKELVVIAARRIAAVADDDDAEVHVAGGENRAGDADIGRVAGDDHGLDAADAEVKFKVRLVESVPAMLWHDDVARCRGDLRRDLRVGRPFMKAREE